jgi:hypothetical protein
MKLEHKSLKHLVTGASGTGKTTFLLRQIVCAEYRNVFIFDGELEIAPRLRCLFSNPETFEMDAERGRIVCVDPMTFAVDLQVAFDFFCDAVFRHAVEHDGNFLFVCDELHRYTTTDRGGNGEAFNRVLELGRRQGIDILIATQSPNLVNTRTRNQITHATIFRLVDDRALRWIEPLGFEVDSIRALKAGEFLTGETCGLERTRGNIF